MRWLTNPVAQFLATGFVTLVVVVVVTGALSRQAADEEAVADARALTQVLGRSVAQPAIPVGLITGDAAAIDRLDRTVLDRLLVGDVRRIKIWSAGGTVLYSDRTELIGAVYPLGDDELEVLEAGGTDAELSDLTRPENRYERAHGGDLLEVYTRVWSPEREPLLFEAYFTADKLGEQRAAVLDRARSSGRRSRSHDPRGAGRRPCCRTPWARRAARVDRRPRGRRHREGRQRGGRAGP